jgi:hypothetical protein
MIQTTVQVRIPGIAYMRVVDGSWPSEHPELWARLDAGIELKKAGRGRVALLTAVPEDLPLLRNYLDGVAEAMLCDLSGLDKDTYASVRGEGMACRTAVDRLNQALGV